MPEPPPEPVVGAAEIDADFEDVSVVGFDAVDLVGLVVDEDAVGDMNATPGDVAAADPTVDVLVRGLGAASVEDEEAIVPVGVEEAGPDIVMSLIP